MNDQGLTKDKVARTFFAFLLFLGIYLIVGTIGGGLIWGSSFEIIKEGSIFIVLGYALLLCFFPMLFIGLLTEKRTKIVYISGATLGAFAGGVFTLVALALASI